MNNSETWTWHEEDDVLAWDRKVAGLGGHPLQSALWGEARKQAEGLRYRCFAARSDSGETGALARVETRSVPAIGRIAWVPKGPVGFGRPGVMGSLGTVLRRAGYMLLASDPWPPSVEGNGHRARTSSGPKTIWIDLSVGKDRLLGNLDSQWRYGARRALRDGVVIEQTAEAASVDAFFGLCTKISEAKGFRLPASPKLMGSLLCLSTPGAAVEARLFAARYHGELVAGVFILRVGSHVHYMWGGVNRAHGKVRAGEAVQWAVMEWAVAQECNLYDLEGIDPVNNPGTYEFKKKMGGRIVQLPERVLLPLSLRGRIVSHLL